MSSVAEIPINHHLGMKHDEQTLVLPETDKTRNHFGQVSFCAQFTLAESASAQCLFDHLGINLEQDMPTLRNATTKFHRPTNGDSLCKLISLEHNRDEFQEILSRKGKVMTSARVEVLSRQGIRALSGNFQWLVIRK